MNRPAPRRTSTVAVLLVLGLAAGACTGDGDDSSSGDATESSSPTSQPAPEVAIRARVGTVAGELPRARRRVVARQVGAVVDDWFDAAYVGGDYPRTDFRYAWPGFTAGARRLAVRQRGIMSNDRIGGRIDGVQAMVKTAQLDVLSPKRRPAAATARVRLVFRTSGERAQRVARRIRTGQVEINGGVFNPLAPFGGYKQSGHGRELGRHALEEYLQVKSMQF